MKRNTLTIVIGVLLLFIFVLLLFTFQVRETEIGVVTTFDRPTKFNVGAGLHWKWPPPIQKVYIFDKRIHNFEGRFEQTLTQDGYPVLAMVYVGWTITNSTHFFSSFPSGRASEAEPALSQLVENGKNEIIGKHPFSHFVSTDPKQLQFAEVEKQILESIRGVASSKYGIDIQFVGIKKLGLPESVTEKVFSRMQAEREREAQSLKAKGEADAMNIRSAADRDRDKILAEAAAEATRIRGQAESEAANALGVFAQNPELAGLLMKLRTLEESMKAKTTIIFDDRVSPFDLLTRQPKPLENRPAQTQAPGGGNPNVLGTPK